MILASVRLLSADFSVSLRMKFAERWVVGSVCWLLVFISSTLTEPAQKNWSLGVLCKCKEPFLHVQYLNCIPAVSASPTLDTHNFVYLQYLPWLSQESLALFLTPFPTFEAADMTGEAQAGIFAGGEAQLLSDSPASCTGG